MNTITDKINDIKANTKNIMRLYPEVTNVWWDFYDCPLDELFELGDTFKCRPEYQHENKYLRLHLTGLGSNVTCFVRSVKCRPIVDIKMGRDSFEEA